MERGIDHVEGGGLEVHILNTCTLPWLFQVLTCTKKVYEGASIGETLRK